MKKVNVIVYTMKGCPFCQDFKKLLEDEKIDFVDRDIHEHEQEYDTYSKITGNDMIPALLIIEGDEKNHKSYLYAPERNYNELTEALELVKKHLI
jgi:glutaredoxin